MASEVKLPRLGQGMESGTIVKWLKREGDRVEKGEPLYELDTDKVTQEVEAEVSGILLKVVVAEGEVPVGKTVAFIGEAGEEVPAEAVPVAAQAETGTEHPPPVDEREEVPVPEPAPISARGNGGRIKASPLARRIARERGVDLAALSGTGPEGRIVAEDVERTEAGAAPAPAAAPAPVVSGEVERRELTSIRRTIARRLTEAWQIPVFQLRSSADMTRVNALVARLRENEEGPKLTVTDVLTKVCALALMRHREVNALYAGDAIELYPSANVGIAVATARGLIVPVIARCEQRTVADIAAARADLVARAREGKLQAADLEGGTFTISNLGMYGVEQFVAVLNPPQGAILAVGTIEERPVARPGRAGSAPDLRPGAGGFADGASSHASVVVRPMLTLTLTCDHRTIDGATAADFLRTVKEFLEEPGLTL